MSIYLSRLDIHIALRHIDIRSKCNLILFNKNNAVHFILEDKYKTKTLIDLFSILKSDY